MTTTPFAAVVREVVTTGLLWIGGLVVLAAIAVLGWRVVARAVDEALTGPP